MKKSYKAIISSLYNEQCNADMIQRCRKCLQENDITACVCLLITYRKELVITMDIQCKRIDCIDYLIHKLESCASGECDELRRDK